MEIKEEALQTFIVAEQKKLYGIAYSYVKDRETALDVVQDTILTAFEKLDTLKNSQSLKPWFYRILINRAITMLRKRRPLVRLEWLDYMEERPYTDQEEAIILYEMVVKLPVKYRTVIMLRYFEDLKLVEIAEILKCPESTVKSRLKRAIRELQKMMEEAEYDERKIDYGKKSLSTNSNAL